jgi:predicted secreted protein
MAKALGSGAVLAVSSNGSAYTTVGKVKSIALAPSVNMVDATDNDSSGTKEKLAGDSEFKLSVTANYDVADTAQGTIIDGCANKTLLYYRYRPKGSTTGEIQYVGTGYLTKCQVDTKHEAVMELQFDVEFTAGVTKSTQ